MKTVDIDNKKLIRDLNSKAVLSTNMNALENYKKARKQKQEEAEEFKTMKDDIAELKEMIKTLIGKQNG
jgi:hypothetical protein|tara:strand:- start:1355 stop:1561 length:207 start_codon:yes stop_codon:yes gene_type:complete